MIRRADHWFGTHQANKADTATTYYYYSNCCVVVVSSYINKIHLTYNNSLLL